MLYLCQAFGYANRCSAIWSMNTRSLGETPRLSGHNSRNGPEQTLSKDFKARQSH